MIPFGNELVSERWTVFQGNAKTGLFQLKIFKSEKEKSLKGAYTINKDNFLGMERGEIRASKNKRKDISTVYLGVILKGGKTICLQETTDSHIEGVPTAVELDKWRHALLHEFFCESWIVYPKKGLQSQEFQMTLHATSYYLSLVTLSPPRSHKVWSMEDITQCESQGDLFLFNISGKETGGYFELRADSVQEARHINQTVKRMVSSRKQERKRNVPTLEIPPALPRRDTGSKKSFKENRDGEHSAIFIVILSNNV
ncbi:hypothetical protein BSL78_09832 [Apostichopus japonicus]|uniref:Uncharacterized protein n=1 Tax=Stichopus japonicus TaxID=307972 RepID=A0A2G8KZ38_STIJA|nr:hypothetical protein BSL78_09832 [Apostichopus japonicus]